MAIVGGVEEVILPGKDRRCIIFTRGLLRLRSQQQRTKGRIGLEGCPGRRKFQGGWGFDCILGRGGRIELERGDWGSSEMGRNSIDIVRRNFINGDSGDDLEALDRDGNCVRKVNFCGM